MAIYGYAPERILAAVERGEAALESATSGRCAMVAILRVEAIQVQSEQISDGRRLMAGEVSLMLEGTFQIPLKLPFANAPDLQDAMKQALYEVKQFAKDVESAAHNAAIEYGVSPTQL